MAGILSTLEKLFEATVGFFEYVEGMGRIINTETDPLPDTISELRSLPAADTPKKRALAEFFQTEAGSKYSTAEREAAYNELLGRERNRENMG